MKEVTKRIQGIKSSSQSLTISSLRYSNEDIKSFFWQEWLASHSQLYLCCLKWMKSNAIDAEDVLSQAMLKAWNEWQKLVIKSPYYVWKAYHIIATVLPILWAGDESALS